MKYRRLGRTGITVSEIGFGCWGIGGDSYGPVNDAESVAALLRAYEKGVTFFDTADVYGDGHSEEIVGEALRSRRDEIVIATKGGTLPHTGFDMPQVFTVSHILESVERSLKRLKTDRIDLYQLHSPPGELVRSSDQIDALFMALYELKRSGKVRSIGISVRSPNDGLYVAESIDVDVIQVNFNMIDQRAQETGLFERCREKSIGVIARTPLAFGFVTGRYSPGVRFDPPDHRANWPQRQLDRWASSASLFAPLTTVDKGLVHLALQFCVSDKAVSTVIPGMLTVEEVDDNVRAAEVEPLTDEEIERIHEIYRTNEFYDPKAKSDAK